MEKISEVFFTDLRTRPGLSLPDKVEKLLLAAGVGSLGLKDKFVAVKLHFGEPGNMAYIRPGYVRRIVRVLEKEGAKVFLTDSNTLYKGGRSNAVDHINAAMENGFNPIEVSAPVVIADGIKGTDCVEVPVTGGRHCTVARIGRAVADADAVISVNHFKGHEQAGFGGALKNLGMGCASVAGKMFLHSDSKPAVDEGICTGCGTCVKNCAHDALSLQARKAVIDYDRCLGCGQCVASCLFGAVRCEQNTSAANLNEKIAEYSKAVLDGKPGMHISFIMDISPECDCWGHNDAAIAPNIGIAASTDPVALDQACADLVMAAPHLDWHNALDDACCGRAGHGRARDGGHPRDEKDIFALIHPDTDWQSALAHSERIGLGSRKYKLVKI